MTQHIILANAKLVLPNEILTGSLAIKEGIITAIDQGATVPKGAINWVGDYVHWV